jgi:hypothetical protein
MNIRVLCLAAAAAALAAVGVGVTASSGASFTAQTTNTATIHAAADWTPPVVAFTVPATITGTTSISATATDTGSGVKQVVIEYAPEASSTWTTLCTDTAAPYTCRFTPPAATYAAYKFHAVATDIAGNQTPPVEALTQVDTVTITGTMSNPGAVVVGTKTLTATGVSSNATISSVVFWARTSSTGGAWTDLCTATWSGGSYGCPWNSANLPDGNYDFKVAVIAGGKTQDSAIVSSRLDNVPAGGDIQAGSGYALVLTYTKLIQPGSIVSGWSGSGGKPVELTLRDGNLVGSGSDADQLAFTDANLGKVNLNANVINPGKTAKLTATITMTTGTWAGQTVSVVSVAFTGASEGMGDLNLTGGTPANMVWTPSSLAKGLNTNLAVSASPVTETGPKDKDF